jgi:hypothetical protein
MGMFGSTAKRALLAALPLELVNYFIVRYPAESHLQVPERFFQAVAAQWYLFHLPGVLVLNELAVLRNARFLGRAILFLSGWIDTGILLFLIILLAEVSIAIVRELIRKPGAEN